MPFSHLVTASKTGSSNHLAHLSAAAGRGVQIRATHHTPRLRAGVSGFHVTSIQPGAVLWLARVGTAGCSTGPAWSQATQSSVVVETHQPFRWAIPMQSDEPRIYLCRQLRSSNAAESISVVVSCRRRTSHVRIRSDILIRIHNTILQKQSAPLSLNIAKHSQLTGSYNPLICLINLTIFSLCEYLINSFFANPRLCSALILLSRSLTYSYTKGFSAFLTFLLYYLIAALRCKFESFIYLYPIILSIGLLSLLLLIRPASSIFWRIAGIMS